MESYPKIFPARARVALSAGLLCLCGCGGVPQTYYYAIAPTDTSKADGGNHHTQLDVTLGVERFSAEAIYEDDRMIYRDSPFEVKYDHYRRWAATPRSMVTDQVIAQLRASKQFRNVVLYPSRQPVDCVLSGRLVAFEEWDRGEQWHGRVALDLQLHDAGAQRLIWNDTMECESPAEKRLPASVVAAISKSLSECISRTASQLVEVLVARKR